MAPICEAHEYANANGLSVRTNPDATYHLGGRALTAVIATDTDWNTSRFTIDDTQVEDHKASIFQVRSQLGLEELQKSQEKRVMQKPYGSKTIPIPPQSISRRPGLSELV